MASKKATTVKKENTVTEPNFDDVDETTTDAELAEVDVPEALDDETDAPAEGTTTATTEKPAKAPKEPKRDAPPEGFITPVDFAKKLTEHLQAKGVSNKNGPITAKSDTEAGNPIPPQYIYSTLNQSKDSDKGMPTYVSFKDGSVHATKDAPAATTENPISRVNLLKLDEALAWWDAKDARVAASKVAKAEKDAKKAAKASEKTETPAEAEAPSEPVVEAE
jgi:hypothetical protein